VATAEEDRLSFRRNSHTSFAAAIERACSAIARAGSLRLRFASIDHIERYTDISPDQEMARPVIFNKNPH
jgi:hypothetical protein